MNCFYMSAIEMLSFIFTSENDCNNIKVQYVSPFPFWSNLIMDSKQTGRPLIPSDLSL